MKPALLIVLLLTGVHCSSQTALRFTKDGRSIQTYWTGSSMAFQTGKYQWQKGELTRITIDSFYVQPVIVRYHMFGKDSIKFKVQGYRISDIYAMPKRGVSVDYGSGGWQVIPGAGNERWHSVKSGKLFLLAGAGYATLLLSNGIFAEGASLSDSKAQLGIAAAVFLSGVIVKKLYRPAHRLNEKYKLEPLDLNSN